MIRFTKIKFDGSKVRIEYENKREDQAQWDEFSLQSADRPVPEFIEALHALRQDVVSICELAETDETKLDVRGVTITHTNDIMGLCITALKALKTTQAPLVLNTPHLPEESYSDTPCPVLDEQTVARLGVLIRAAERYVDGERAQGDLLAAAKPAELEHAAAH
jgi:hypothetical protein